LSNKLANSSYTLTEEIGLMTNLKTLVLTCTKLISISPEFGKLTNLTELSLNNNILTSIPWEFNYLRSLTRLDLSQNKLREFSILNYKNFSQLSHLNICENRFHSPFLKKISFRSKARGKMKEEKLQINAHKFLCFVKAKDHCYFILRALQNMNVEEESDELYEEKSENGDIVMRRGRLTSYFIPNDISFAVVAIVNAILMRDLERSCKFVFPLATDRLM
jgi:hypothetical protein